MRKIALLVIASVTLFACNDDGKFPTKLFTESGSKALAPCNVDDPLNDLPWFKAEIDTWDSLGVKNYFFLVKADYKGEVVYKIDTCCPMCCLMIMWYKCDGTTIQDPDISEIKNAVVIWRPEDFICHL